MSIKILVTGGAGFSGSHLCDFIMDQTDWDLIVLDALTYAGNLSNLSRIIDDPIRSKRFTFIRHDFSKPLGTEILDICDGVEYIVHLGAETHVRNSLENPEPFIKSNIVGTYNMLEAAVDLKPHKFLYISTDEVFGASIFPCKESDGLRPSNPYSASKASGELLVHAYMDSFDLPVLVTRSSNLYGLRQHEEKFIPMTVQKVKNAQAVDIHMDPYGQIGSRQWLHTSDQSSAILFLLQGEQVNETYHIAGERQSNLHVASAIAEKLDMYLYTQMVNAFDEFKGHDLHYNLDDSKIRALGWQPKLTFEQGLALTV